MTRPLGTILSEANALLGEAAHNKQSSYELRMNYHVVEAICAWAALGGIPLPSPDGQRPPAAPAEPDGAPTHANPPYRPRPQQSRYAPRTRRAPAGRHPSGIGSKSKYPPDDKLIDGILMAKDRLGMSDYDFNGVIVDVARNLREDRFVTSPENLSWKVAKDVMAELSSMIRTTETVPPSEYEDDPPM